MFITMKIELQNRTNFTFSTMAVEKISESVYVGMCLKIGTTQQVASRRDIADIKEMLVQNAKLKHQSKTMVSGNRREGFRLSGSDLNIMFWPNDHRVCLDLSQHTQEHKLILCDSSESPPGFSLLWLQLESANSIVKSACVEINGGLYISSLKYKEITCHLLIPGSSTHGPCSSGIVC